MILAQSGGPAGASSTGTGATGGSPSPQTSGEPKAPTAPGSRPVTGSTMSTAPAGDFNAIDKNGDGQISRAEWDAYRSGSAASGGASASPASPSGSVVSPSGSGKTGATAGPRRASPRPRTRGHGDGPSTSCQGSRSTYGTGARKPGAFFLEMKVRSVVAARVAGALFVYGVQARGPQSAWNAASRRTWPWGTLPRERRHQRQKADAIMGSIYDVSGQTGPRKLMREIMMQPQPSATPARHPRHAAGQGSPSSFQHCIRAAATWTTSWASS